MIDQLSHEETIAILEASGDAHLGCIVDGEPYVIPVHYVLQGDAAYLHSLPGMKIDGMRVSPRVCLQVQVLKGEYHWRSVQAFGTYEEIDDEEERTRVLTLLFERFPRLTPADAVRRHGIIGPPSIVFRIRFDRVVGVGEG